MSDNFKKIKRDEEGRVWQKQLYVTYGTKCQCNCECCRNKSFDKDDMRLDRSRLHKKVLDEANNFRHIVFGGGEPLLSIDKIYEIIKDYRDLNPFIIGDDSRTYFTLVTNGERNRFLKLIDENCKNCRMFENYIISRYHYDDNKNESIFRTRGTLMTKKDLENLCEALKQKIQLSCLCQKGGINTVEDAKKYIEFAMEVGITDVMFSNFQDDVTVEEAKSLNCKPNLLQEIKELIEGLGFEREGETIVFSAGFKLTNYKGTVIKHTKAKLKPKVNPFLKLFMRMIGADLPTPNVTMTEVEEAEMRISFREFISEEELQNEWNNSKKRTYNYSIMPNGTMYSDWSCREEVN